MKKLTIMETGSIFKQQACRICFEETDKGILVFSDEGKKFYLQTKIRKYLYVTVTVDDIYSKMICNNCVETINKIHVFATMALSTQEKFFKSAVTSNSNDENKFLGNCGLLLSYLMQDNTEKSSNSSKNNDNTIIDTNENEITELEVKVDPMMILQYNDDSNVSNTSAIDENDSVLDENSTEPTKPIKPKITVSKQQLKPYTCCECLKSFVSEIALQGHIWSHTNKIKGSNKERNDKKDKRIDKNDDSSNDTSDNQNYSCPVCRKQISTKGNLKVHLDTHKPKGKYGCSICGRIFKTQLNLFRHKDYHEGTQYPCKVCGRVYPTNSTLKAHMITHSNLRPHKCQICDKTFKRNQDLKFHINQHTGARPYECPYCPKAFASSGNCFSHRKRMHPQEVERDRERVSELMI